MSDAASMTEPKPMPLAPPVPPGEVASAVEAILLTDGRPVPARRLADVLGLGGDDSTPRKQIEDAVDSLNRVYESTGRSFRIEQVAGGYRVMTLPALASVLAAYHGGRAASRLSRAALETLSSIAYKQPLTRGKLEAVRGVACGEVLRSLMERRLITMTGRAEELGRPMLYGTTKAFLDAFGLASLKDMPSAGEFAGTP
jgi:segregation and condensation protein B